VPAEFNRAHCLGRHATRRSPNIRAKWFSRCAGHGVDPVRWKFPQQQFKTNTRRRGWLRSE
jgi:hypothetical protein